VDRTFVYGVLKEHRYDIACLRKNIKAKPAMHYPMNSLWQMDLMFMASETKKQSTVFGIVDAGSRVCLSLQWVRQKNQHYPIAGIARCH
jgi:hypothetical protein